MLSDVPLGRDVSLALGAPPNISLDNPAHCAAAIGALVANRRFADAEALAAQAIALHPQDVAIAVERARIANASGDWDEAHRRWRRAQMDFPGHWIALAGTWTTLRAEGVRSPYRVGFGAGARGASLRMVHPDPYCQLGWSMAWVAGALEWAFGASRIDAEADNGSIAAGDQYWPHIRFHGHWPQTPAGAACKAALEAALTMTDASSAAYLGIEGLSGAAFRVFLNGLLRGLPQARYLELGVGVGSAMAAALHGNAVSATGIDDFSESKAAKARLLDNVGRVDRAQSAFRLIEESFDAVSLDGEEPFDVVFYDGPVAADAVVTALSAALPAMKDVAVYIFDDWNAQPVREGYRRLVDGGYVREIAAIDIRTTLNNGHPSFYGAQSGWHNGCRIALLERLALPQPATTTPTTMSEAGAEVVAIESAAPFHGAGSVVLGATFPNAGFFERRERTSTQNSYLLRDVVCSFRTMLVYAKGRPIRETSYLVSDDEFAQPAPPRQETEFPDTPQTVIQPLSRPWPNYYHWIAQCLPAILAGTSRGGDKRLALPHLNRRYEESLALLGVQDYPRLTVQMGRAYGFRALEVSDFIYGRSAFVISTTARDVFRTMKERVGRGVAGGARLYLTRRDAGHRRLHNDAALTDLLVRRGFQIVDPGAFTVSQQIGLFRNAEVIVAPHGAALTNIGFCEPGALIYELMPADYANACFNRIAQLMELRYVADAFPSDAEGAPFERSFTADIATVSARLDSLGV